MKQIRQQTVLSSTRPQRGVAGVGLRGCEKKGTGSRLMSKNVWKTSCGSVPVPFFSQPLDAAQETPGLRTESSSPGHPRINRGDCIHVLCPIGPHQTRRTAQRAGAALAEVLIALLVMGIGVVSAATMFPIAVLRTVQATQLTRSTVLRFNAEVQLDLHPELIDTAHIPLPAAGNVTTAVVDPLGYHLTGAGLFSGGTDVNGAAIVDPAGAPAPLSRVNMTTVPGAMTEQQAEQLVTLPDSWSVQVDDVVASATATSVTLASPIPAGISTTGGQTRITLFHSSGRKSVVRTVTSIVGNVVSWAATPALPAEYTATTIERAVVETRNRHFTWMMTVRKNSSGQSNIHVVVFFNRGHEASDETAFLTIPANTLNKKFQIDIPSPLPAGVIRPLLRRGKYLFDPVNARWYRIAQVEGEETNTPTITLNEAPIEPIRYAVFLPRIVDVFPIR